MKRLLVLCVAFLFCFSLCSCSVSASRIQSNLEKAGYEIEEMEQDVLKERNNELTYNYKGNGSIIKGFFAYNEASRESVTVLEFTDKSDLTIMYKLAKQSIDSESESVDLSGYILVFGSKGGVEAALK